MADERTTAHLLATLHDHLAQLGPIAALPSRRDRVRQMGKVRGRMLQDITELRRRGDTLVQRDDLRNVISYVEISTSGQYASVQFGECVERLKNALRGDTFPTGRENT